MSAQNPYITPQKIQLFLLDRGASDNFLLDDREFQDDQIDQAVELTVAKYNTTDPFIDFQTAESFPFKYEFLLGITSILLRSKALNMIRNRVNYSTQGGVTIDEKSSAEAYLAMAQQMSDEFDQRIKKIKAFININQGYGAVGSIYSILNLGTGSLTY